jgi:hypothetical protein
MSGEWIVGLVLEVVRVEAAVGSIRTVTRPDNGALARIIHEP